MTGALDAVWLGRVGYEEGAELQSRIARSLREQGRTGYVLLLEHPHVFTMGRAAEEENLVWTEAERQRRGVALASSDRGGDVTYHGPGQLVGYPVLDLRRLGLDILGYLRALEESLVAYLRGLALETAPGDRDHIGVWAGDEKVAAIGIKATQGITSHGFALNLTTDLAYFEGIIGCGLADRGATSVARLGGPRLATAEAARGYMPHLGRALNVEWAWLPQSAFHRRFEAGVPSLGSVHAPAL
jgi:lipoate-protein ligase B